MGLLSPWRLLTVAIFLGLALTLAIVVTAIRQPWLGLQLEADPATAGLQVIGVFAAGPADAAGITPGDRLLSVGTGDQRHQLIATDRIEEPDMLPDRPARDGFRARQGHIHDLLTAGETRLELGTAAGTVEKTVTAQPQRPAATLPLVFWLQIIVGLSGFWIGAWVLALRPRGTAERAFFLTGVGLMMAAFTAAVYSTRELALPQAAYGLLSPVNSTGANLFGAGMICLFLSYPRRLVRPQWLPLVPAVAIATGILAEFGPVHTLTYVYQVPILIQLSSIILLVALQYRATRGHPAERAALRWFGLAVMAGSGAFILATVVPTVLGLPTFLSQGYSFLFFLLVHIGLALGVVRYRLFDLQRWSFNVLFYMAGAALLLATDALLILFLPIDHGPALGLSLLLVGLLYMPARDMLARKLLRSPAPAPERSFAALLDSALATTAEDRASRWKALLAEEFGAMAVVENDTVSRQPLPAIVEDGTSILMPGIEGLPQLKISWSNGGRRLFGPADLERARGLLRMFAHAIESGRAHERGVAEERTRISRDMHDNIGIQLLGALHSDTASRKNDLIREALTDLREIIAARTGDDIPADELLADLRAETHELLRAGDVELDWSCPEDMPRLPARQSYALRSILREASGNILRHAAAQTAAVTIRMDGHVLQMEITDDGRGFQPEADRPGNGLGNMQARAAGVDGSFHIGPDRSGRGTRILLRLPLPGTARRTAPPHNGDSAAADTGRSGAGLGLAEGGSA